MVQEESKVELADALIVVRCQLGERAAFDLLMHRWSEPILCHASRLIDDPEHARDLAQEIWLRVLRGIGGLRDQTRFRSWLFGIAHRAFADTLRTSYKEPGRVEFDLDDLPAAASEEEDVNEALYPNLAKLPPIEREVLMLFYLQELSMDEMSVALAIPIGTVKSRLHRARRLLRTLMNPMEHAV